MFHHCMIFGMRHLSEGARTIRSNTEKVSFLRVPYYNKAKKLRVPPYGETRKEPQNLLFLRVPYYDSTTKESQTPL